MPKLQQAVRDLSWLLSRGYPRGAALKLVGDRFRLDRRQRLAVERSACSEQSLQTRRQTRLPAAELVGRRVDIDGFNLLTTIEAALAGGVLILGRDGCLRDMASMHGNYRKVNETRPALELIGRELERLQVASAGWWLDRPVSNSGRLGAIIRDTARMNGWDWDVELADNPDRALIGLDSVVVSADRGAIEHCRHWANIARHLVDARVDGSPVIRFDDLTAD